MELHFPMPLTIRCYQCGKVYDVALTSEEPQEFPCPACGKLEVFAVGALKEKVLSANQRLFRSLGGRR